MSSPRLRRLAIIGEPKRRRCRHGGPGALRRVPRPDVTQPSRVRALPAVRGAHSLAGVRQRTRLVTRVYVDLLRSASALCR
ncbi:putative leader peptide [Streptomyces sp. NBC_00448]|uniref:putative leader peptide n=1 Tax=Streptomyces sp. NBC_00448 TaxID=2903652 RepID=UPI003FA70DF9